MRVLMTTDSIGGVWTYSLELIQALAAHGVKVSLASMGSPLTTDQQAQVAQIANAEIFESNYRLEWMHDPWDDVHAAGRWLLQLRDRVEPDVIHLNNFVHGSLDWRVPVMVVGHSCVCSWMEAVRGCAAGPEWDEYRGQVQSGIQSADVVVAPTRHMLDDLNCHYGPWAHGRVIYNGKSSSAVEPAAREPFILSAGRLWDEAKNVRLLAEIADQLDWPILVAGNARHPDSRGRNDWGNLRMLGQLPHRRLQSLMRRAAIYALPAKYEPFGLTPLEAALNGCPLLLGDIGTLREVWGAAALFESPDSPHDWVRRLNTLIADAAVREQFSVAAARRAGEYSSQRMAADYYDAYCRLVKQHDLGASHFPGKAVV